ncbi:Uncharacterized protein HZ326_20053 [Fusarium oxysporum f. sp. albedinis]|nr:Uncharacterized protein HZ326_20053 [Fusarium oxysporum f. sp. albedinis]
MRIGRRERACGSYGDCEVYQCRGGYNPSLALCRGRRGKYANPAAILFLLSFFLVFLLIFLSVPIVVIISFVIALIVDVFFVCLVLFL